MIESFTDAQDASWSQVVSQVQAANDVGVVELQQFADVNQEVHAESSRRAVGYRAELDLGSETASAQRQAGRGALEDVTSGLRTRLEGYSRETVVQAGEHVQVVDGFCGRMGAGAASGRSIFWDEVELTIDQWRARGRVGHRSNPSCCTRSRGVSTKVTNRHAHARLKVRTASSLSLPPCSHR